MLLDDLLGGAGGNPKRSPARSRKPSRSGSRAAKPVPFSTAASSAAGRFSTALPSISRRSEVPAFERTELTKLTPFLVPADEEEEREEGAAGWTSDAGMAFASLYPGTGVKREPTGGFAAHPRNATGSTGEEQEKGEAKPKVRRTYEMTWEDYNALSDEQRAAVDFNTLLVQAREKDLNTEYSATPKERTQYDKAVEAMFGEGNGSETYAPETLAVLRQIDYEARDTDLDDFLGLKATISEDELVGFSTELEPMQGPLGALGVPAPASTEQDVAVGTSQLQAAMAKSNQVLQDFQTTAAAGRNTELSFFGGQPNEVSPALGYGTDADRPANQQGIDAFFQNVFTALSLKENESQLGEIWGMVESADLKPDEEEALLRYVDERSSRQEEFGLDLGPGRDRQYRTPEEFRALFGLDRRAE